MKRIGLLALVVIMALGLIACGKNDKSKDQTIGQTLLEDFKTLAETDSSMDSIAQKLTENKCFNGIAMQVTEVSPGYLNGFNSEVTDFISANMFSPMIGTIPFVGYIFSSDNPEALAQELKDKAMLNWNICTTADEMVVEVVNGYVFFVMAPNTFDEN